MERSIEQATTRHHLLVIFRLTTRNWHSSIQMRLSSSCTKTLNSNTSHSTTSQLSSRLMVMHLRVVRTVHQIVHIYLSRTQMWHKYTQTRFNFVLHNLLCLVGYSCLVLNCLWSVIMHSVMSELCRVRSQVLHLIVHYLQQSALRHSNISVGVQRVIILFVNWLILVDVRNSQQSVIVRLIVLLRQRLSFNTFNSIIRTYRQSAVVHLAMLLRSHPLLYVRSLVITHLGRTLLNSHNHASSRFVRMQIGAYSTFKDSRS